MISCLGRSLSKVDQRSTLHFPTNEYKTLKSPGQTLLELLLQISRRLISKKDEANGRSVCFENRKASQRLNGAVLPMLEVDRQKVLQEAATVVVKVGTNVLTNEEGMLSTERFASLTHQLYRLRDQGKQVVLVSSGAVGAGMGRLGLKERPVDLRHLQACAAVGQSYLMQVYEDHLSKYGIHTAQILLTASDFDHRARYLNARNTLLSLFEWGCLPIINENDTVSIDEIRFSDNDHLAAQVTNLLQAPLLIILSVVNGLYERDPRLQADLQPVPVVEEIDERVLRMAGATQSRLGKGGMRSKLKSARMVTAAGEAVLLANGNLPNVLDRIFEGEAIGTLFLPHRAPLPAWKRWLGYTARPRGELLLDIGAVKAVQHQGRSLLPIGISQVNGSFDKGEVVSVKDVEGVEIARGLTNYGSTDLKKICGLRTDQIGEALGAFPYEEVIHRDNLVVVV